MDYELWTIIELQCLGNKLRNIGGGTGRIYRNLSDKGSVLFIYLERLGLVRTNILLSMGLPD